MVTRVFNKAQTDLYHKFISHYLSLLLSCFFCLFHSALIKINLIAKKKETRKRTRKTNKKEEAKKNKIDHHFEFGRKLKLCKRKVVLACCLQH